jgi:adenylate cyclase
MTAENEADGAPRLTFTDGPEARQFSLGQGQVWTIGRAFDNQVVVDDTSISRKHAMLQRLEGGDIVLVDLGSANGTFVNGRRVSVPVTLRPGDRITFGTTNCNFTVPGAVAALAPETLRAAEFATRILQTRKLLTVMVVDVRGFTALTRQINEQTLSAVMGHWFQQASRITQRTGGWVDKYIGDAIMALWTHEQDDPSRVQASGWLQAAAEVLQMTAKVGDRFPLPVPMQAGVGINTGFAVVSNTGPRDHPEYTAFGDTVNAAFRLESATRTLGCDVLIGESSWQALSRLHASDIFTRVSVALKGYEGETTAYSADQAGIVAMAARATNPTARMRTEPERR